MNRDIELYRKAGAAVARARFYGDETRATFEKNHVKNMLSVESGQDAVNAEAAYQEAYTSTSKQLRRI